MNYWDMHQAAEDKLRKGQERLVWLVVGLMWVCVAVGIVVAG